VYKYTFILYKYSLKKFPFFARKHLTNDQKCDILITERKKEVIKMTIKKLTTMPYAQAHVEIDEQGNINLFSYVTLVASIDSDGWLTINGLYSQTTRRHIGCFMKEYANSDYATAKLLYNDNYKMNLHTGELIPA
jgi:hypothetical protein